MGEIRSGDRRITTAALSENAARAASGFLKLGIGRGDTVALYLRNDFAFLEGSMAAGLIGAYPVPVNWHYTVDEARYLFENSGAKAIVIHADLLEPIRAALPGDVAVLVVPTPPEIAKAYGIAEVDTRVPAEAQDWNVWLATFPPFTQGLADPPGTIIYTSGTTGRPKGVRRTPPTQEQAAAQLAILCRGFGFAQWLTEPDKMVVAVVGPMYHSAPNAYGNFATRLGANVILEPRFDAEDLLRMIERERVTHIHMVPIMFNRLLKLPDAVKRKYDLSSLKFIVHAAAPVSPVVKREMIEWWGPVINEYYGATETGIVVFCDSKDWLAHPGTVGRAIPEADVRVIDVEWQRAWPTGEIGEVVARVRAIPDFTYHGDDQKRRDSEKVGPHRAGRRRLFRCGRLPLSLRPRERHGDLRRRQHLSGRDRKRAAQDAGRGRLRRVRHSRRGIWRGDLRGGADAARPALERNRCAVLSARARGGLQSAEESRFRARSAARGFRQDLQTQAARALLGRPREADQLARGEPTAAQKIAAAGNRGEAAPICFWSAGLTKPPEGLYTLDLRN